MIHTIIGDVTKLNYPDNGLNFIPQICNDLGKYGAGLSGALSSKWPVVAKSYFEWYGGHGKGASDIFKLGEIQIVPVEKNVAVVNMIAQKGVRGRYNPVPIRYQYLEACVLRLFGSLTQYSKLPDGYIKIWCPKIGTGLAGGDWDRIQSTMSHWFNRIEFELNYVMFQDNQSDMRRHG